MFLWLCCWAGLHGYGGSVLWRSSSTLVRSSIYLNGTIRWNHCHHVPAVRARVFHILEPTGHTRNASEADTEKAAEHTSNPVQEHVSLVHSKGWRGFKEGHLHLHRCPFFPNNCLCPRVAKWAINPLRCLASKHV